MGEYPCLLATHAGLLVYPRPAEQTLAAVSSPRMAGTGSYQQLQEQTNIPGKTEKFDPQINHFGRIYIFAQFLVTTGLALYTLINAPDWDYQKTADGRISDLFAVRARLLVRRKTFSILHELLRLGGAALLLSLLQPTAGYQLCTPPPHYVVSTALD